MVFLLVLLIVAGTPFGIYQAQKRIADPGRKNLVSYAGVAGLTFCYWVYESRTGGNIRVDLLLFYPILFASYVILLWPHLKWLSIIPALVLMGLNFGFFTMSYHWFGKSWG